MLLLFQQNYLVAIVAALFAECFRILAMPLFQVGSKNISLWSISLSLIMFSVFKDFLQVTGVWGYSEDEFEDEVID